MFRFENCNVTITSTPAEIAVTTPNTSINSEDTSIIDSLVSDNTKLTATIKELQQTLTTYDIEKSKVFANLVADKETAIASKDDEIQDLQNDIRDLDNELKDLKEVLNNEVQEVKEELIEEVKEELIEEVKDVKEEDVNSTPAKRPVRKKKIPTSNIATNAIVSKDLPEQTKDSISVDHPLLNGFEFINLSPDATRINSKLIIHWLSKVCPNINKDATLNTAFSNNDYNDLKTLDNTILKNISFFGDDDFELLTGLTDMHDVDLDLVEDMLQELKAVLEIENSFGKSPEQLIEETNEAFEQTEEFKTAQSSLDQDVKKVDWSSIDLPTKAMTAQFKEDNEGRAGKKAVLTYIINNLVDNIDDIGGVDKISKMSGSKLEVLLKEILINVPETLSEGLTDVAIPANAIEDNEVDYSEKQGKKSNDINDVALNSLQKFQKLVGMEDSDHKNFLTVAKVLDVDTLNRDVFFKDIVIPLFSIGSRRIYLEALNAQNTTINKASDNDLLIIYKHLINTLLK